MNPTTPKAHRITADCQPVFPCWMLLKSTGWNYFYGSNWAELAVSDATHWLDADVSNRPTWSPTSIPSPVSSQDIEGTGAIPTVAEAEQIALRFINRHFGNAGEMPRASIPADPRRDDDIRLLAFIRSATPCPNQPAQEAEPQSHKSMPCPHCGDTLLWSEDRGAHCDGCDDFDPETDLPDFPAPSPAEVGEVREAVEQAITLHRRETKVASASFEVIRFQEELRDRILSAIAPFLAQPATPPLPSGEAPLFNAMFKLWEDYLGTTRVGNIEVTRAMEKMRDVESALADEMHRSIVLRDMLEAPDPMAAFPQTTEEAFYRWIDRATCEWNRLYAQDSSAEQQLLNAQRIKNVCVQFGPHPRQLYRLAPPLPVVRDVGGTRGDGKDGELWDYLDKLGVWNAPTDSKTWTIHQGGCPGTESTLRLSVRDVLKVLVENRAAMSAQADAGRDEK